MTDTYNDIKNSIISISGRTFDDMTSKELKEELKKLKLVVKPAIYVNDDIRKSHPSQFRNVKNTRYLLYGNKGITVAHRSYASNPDIIAMYYYDFIEMFKKQRAIYEVEEQINKVKHNNFINFITQDVIVEEHTDWYMITCDLVNAMQDTINAVRNASYTTEDVILRPEFNCGDNVAQFNRIQFTNNIFDDDITKFLTAIDNNNNRQYFEHVTGIRIGKSIYGIGNSCENNKIEFTMSFTFDEETTRELKIKEESFNSYMER